MTDVKKLETENAKLRTENKKLRSAMEELLWYTWQLERDAAFVRQEAVHD